MPRAILYRYAGPDDLPALSAFMGEFFESAASYWQPLQLAPEKVEAFIGHLLATGICLVALDGEKIVGSIGLGRETPWYSHQNLLVEHWTLVLPAYRKSRISDTLMKWTKAVSDQQGVDLHIGQLSGTEVARKAAWYLRHGFQLMGQNYFRAAR